MAEIKQNAMAYILSRDDRFRYQLLDRMRQDCLYFLSYGSRNPKCLWGEQCGKADRIYESDLAKLSCRWENRVADDGRNHITGKDDGGRGCTC